MTIVYQLINAFFWLIRGGVITRIIVILIKMMSAEEEQASLKKRLRNLIIFYVLAESVWVLKDIAFYYFQE